MSGFNNISLLDGPNFSGRSHYLKSITGFDNDNAQGIYLGSNPTDFLTGLANSVKFELELHGWNGANHSSLSNILKELGFDRKLSQNPFTLSGGEQAALVIICASLLSHSKIGIDLLFEQFHDRWKTLLLDYLSRKTQLEITIADNRTKEYSDLPKIINYGSMAELEQIDSRLDFGKMKCVSNGKFHKKKGLDLALSDLSFAYSRANKIFENISIHLKAGNLYHLIGENGAGKSTLSKILTGVLRPSGNSKIRMGGKEIIPFKNPGKHVAYCFQNPDEQLFSKTVKQELWPKYMPSENEIERIVTWFGLESILDENPNDLPWVIRKRISIAATLCLERHWYILDEPTVGLDEHSVITLSLIIQTLLDEGKSFIIISHSSTFFDKFENSKEILLLNGKLKTNETNKSTSSPLAKCE
jgi:energy-coupling factor transport system ATP-binding protein